MYIGNKYTNTTKCVDLGENYTVTKLENSQIHNNNTNIYQVSLYAIEFMYRNIWTKKHIS